MKTVLNLALHSSAGIEKNISFVNGTHISSCNVCNYECYNFLQLTVFTIVLWKSILISSEKNRQAYSFIVIQFFLFFFIFHISFINNWH